MSRLLDLVYLLTLFVCSPFLIARRVRSGKYREGMAERLRGKAPTPLGDGPCIWFHAVSVGEVLLLKRVIAELLRRRPDWNIVISATTPTGLAVARRSYPELVTFFAPLDFSWAAANAVSRIRPTVLALVELEIWPNLVAAAQRVGAKTVIINGRMSARSAKGYGLLKFALAPTFRRLDRVAVQTREYADRFEALGVAPERICVTGSVKYDNLSSDRSHPRVLALRSDLGLEDFDRVFVAGSTMEGEEAAALGAYRRAIAEFPDLVLIITPRHLERFKAVGDWLRDQGVEPVLRSSGARLPAAGSGGRDRVVLIDTLGELADVWGLAEIAFVGGSLYPGRGGQNMLEPAAFGASVLFGRHTSNFRHAVEQLLDRSAAREVRDADELAEALLEDLRNPDVARRRGIAAARFLAEQKGASERTVEEIEDLVESTLGRARATAPVHSSSRFGSRSSSSMIRLF